MMNQKKHTHTQRLFFFSKYFERERNPIVEFVCFIFRSCDSIYVCAILSSYLFFYVADLWLWRYIRDKCQI